MSTKIGKIGTKEDRINRFFRMCLEWQYDLRNRSKKPNTYYFKKYKVGKYAQRYFDDIASTVIDREFILNKMEYIQNSYNIMREEHKRNKQLNYNA